MNPPNARDRCHRRRYSHRRHRDSERGRQTKSRRPVRFRVTPSLARTGAPSLSGGKKPGDDEQCDARPHHGVPAPEQPSREPRPDSKPARHRVRSEDRETGTDDRKGDDVRTLGDLPEPFQDHATVSVKSAGGSTLPADSGRCVRRRSRRPRSLRRCRCRHPHVTASGADVNGASAQPRRAIASTSSLCTAPPPPKFFIASSWRISSAWRLYA